MLNLDILKSSSLYLEDMDSTNESYLNTDLKSQSWGECSCTDYCQKSQSNDDDCTSTWYKSK